MTLIGIRDFDSTPVLSIFIYDPESSLPKLIYIEELYNNKTGWNQGAEDTNMKLFPHRVSPDTKLFK